MVLPGRLGRRPPTWPALGSSPAGSERSYTKCCTERGRQGDPERKLRSETDSAAWGEVRRSPEPGLRRLCRVCSGQVSGLTGEWTKPQGCMDGQPLMFTEYKCWTTGPGPAANYTEHVNLDNEKPTFSV